MNLAAEDRGVLVPFADADAIAREVIGLLRDRQLIIPYAMSGNATTFATVSLDELLDSMEWAGPCCP